MILSEDLIASSEQRLTFDPEELSKKLDDRNPIENEPPERVKIRLAVAESQGLNTLERIIASNDYHQVRRVRQFLMMSGRWLLCIIQESLKKMPMETI